MNGEVNNCYDFDNKNRQSIDGVHILRCTEN